MYHQGIVTIQEINEEARGERIRELLSGARRPVTFHDFTPRRTSGLRALRPLGASLALFAILFTLLNTDLAAWSDKLARLMGNRVIAADLSQDWVRTYSIVVTDRLTPDSDSDQDGLTFAEEERAFTHPFNPDTDGDGASDKDEIAAGQNPHGAGILDEDQDALPDNWESANGLDPAILDGDHDLDQDGLSNALEYAHGTDPRAADSDGDGFADLREILNGFDPAAPGQAKPSVTVLISKINVATPMIWSETEDDQAMLRDLEQGVIRYPDTAVPGGEGNLIIAGHSSNYVWAKGDYNSVFRHLGKLEAGDQVTLRVKQANGKTFDYVYQIGEKRVVRADNPWIFEDPENKSELTLSTCWPIGTTLSRLVLKAELVSADHSV